MLCTRKTIGGGICQVCMEDLPKCQDIKQEPIEYLLYICASCCTHSYCHYSYYYCPACYITLDDEVPDLENLDQLPKKGYIQLDCCRYYNHNDWLLPLYHVSIFSTLKEDDSPDEWNGMEWNHTWNCWSMYNDGFHKHRLVQDSYNQYYLAMSVSSRNNVTLANIDIHFITCYRVNFELWYVVFAFFDFKTKWQLWHRWSVNFAMDQVSALMIMLAMSSRY